MFHRIAILFLVALGTGAAAQQPPVVERLLLPGVTAEATTVPGAFGSMWQSHVAVTSTASRTVLIYGYNAYRFGSCGIALCTLIETPANTTFVPQWRPDPTIPNGSAQFLWVDKRFSDQVTVAVRVQDMSRQALTWGTALPVAREGDFSLGEQNFVDIPTEESFRWTLRVYEPDGRPDAMVTVRFYDTNPRLFSPIDPILDPRDPQPSQPDRLVHEQLVTLTPYGGTGDYRFAYAQLSSDNVPTPVQSARRLRLTVTPAVNGVKTWALVSITNNETQHVTLITPQ